MKITKKTECVITLYEGDMLSNISVMDPFEGFRENQVGCLLNEDGTPHYVCTKLVLERGCASNVRVGVGGVVEANEGLIDRIDVSQHGELNVVNATVMNVEESGGTVTETGSGKVTYVGNIGVAIIDGFATVHNGSVLTTCSILKGGNVHVCPNGKVTDIVVCELGHLTITGGIADRIKVEGGSIYINKGTLSNSEIKKGTVFLQFNDPESIDHVVVRSGVKINRRNYEHGPIPSLKDFILEKGVIIEDEFDDGENGLFVKTTIYSESSKDQIERLN